MELLNNNREYGADSPRRILFLTHLPPPVHGVGLVNGAVLKIVNCQKNFSIRVIPIRPGNSLTTIGKLTLRKYVYSLGLFLKLLYHLAVFRPHFLYFSLTPIPPALYRDVGLVALIKLFKTKRIFHLHRQGISKIIQRSNFHRRLYKFLFSNATIVHLTPLLAQRELLDTCIIDSKRVRIIGNPLIAPVQKIETVKKEKQLLFFSNLIALKGIDLLIESMKMVIIDEPQVKLVIAGGEIDPTYTQSLQTKIQTLGLANNVTLVINPKESAKIELFNQSSLFILPSVDDCFPLAINEAICYKIPVLTSKIGGLNSVFLSNEGVVFIDPVNADTISNTILWALKNRSKLGIEIERGATRVDRLTQDFPECILALFKH